MALNVNGYNDTFQNFVDFAKIRNTMGDKTAIARVTTGVNVAEGALAGRTITASDTDSLRGIFKWFRSADDKAANDATRKIFKDAIIDMFGGESKIPEAVKKAMILGDYDKGKPLTARRILAVKAAIDASGTKEARTDKLRLETFQSPAVEKAARDMGYMKSELPKLARAAHFYAQANGVSEADAMREVGRPGSEANRLMNYGGRFLESADNFANGLRLISQFSDWHDGISAIRESIQGSEPSYAGLDTPSKVNVDGRAAHPDAKLGLERFILEDIATNPSFNLKEDDAERAFGVEHNPVSRHMIVAGNYSTLGTIANVPPAKRRTVYAAFNAINTLAETGPGRADRKSITLESLFLARILRNLPKLESILSKTGTLTARDIIKTCYPDIRDPGNYDVDTIAKWEDDLNDTLDRMQEEGEIDRSDRAAITSMMESSGATLKEAQNAYESGKKIPPNQYFSTLQFSILEAAPTADSGINTMKGDIERISTYTDMTDDGNMFSAEKHRWNFTFPDGERLKTGGASKNDIQRVEEKIRNLCGEVHQKQIGAVAYLLSQSGTGVLRDRPLAKYGINSNEHSPVNFALSRNAETGAVTITYTSPKELPVKFSWTATADIDGNVTSTPFTVSDVAVRNPDQQTAKSMVQDAAKTMGRRLNGNELTAAADIFMRNADGMWQKNAKLFAQFVAKLPLDDAHVAKSGQKADAFAKEIKGWSNIDLGDGSVSEIAGKIKTDFNGYIAKNMPNANSYGQVGKPDYDNVFGAMITDANRNVFVINGQRFAPGDKNALSGDKLAAQVVSAFKQAVPTEKAQKAISTIMHQGGFNAFITMGMKVPYSPTGSNESVVLNQLPGGEKFVARDMVSGHFLLPLLDDSSMKATLKLDVAPDGNTATLTLIANTGLTTGNSKGDNFGNVELTQKITFDLRPDVPVVTDVQLGQQLL